MTTLDPRALYALKNNQRQLDMDGVEVGVSRQALDELLSAYAALSQPQATAPAGEGMVTEAPVVGDRKRIDDALVSCAGLLRALASDDIARVAAGELDYVRTAIGKESGWRPTHRHVRRGSEYEIIGQAQVQCSDGLTDYEVATVYRGKDGQLWVRRKSEFEDGRFEAIATAPKQGAK